MNGSGSATKAGLQIEQAIILCGGKGTRLGELAKEVPKPMVAVGGRPVLDHVIENLAKAGVRRFILAAGHLGNVIAEHYAAGRNTPAGCLIETVIETEALGTAGALAALAERLDEAFVVAYGDVFIDFVSEKLIRSYAIETATRMPGPLGTLLTRASDHPADSDLIVPDECDPGRVAEFVHRREPGRRYANVGNAAVYVLSRRVLEFIPRAGPSDFGRDIFPAVLAAGGMLRLHGLEPGGFVKDMGTPARLELVAEYLREREAARAARARPAALRVVLLDRDGVLNDESAGLVDEPEKLRLLPGAAQAVAMLNHAGMRCLVVTNQAVVARGLCTEETLAKIHARLRFLIEVDGGGRLDAILHCPHHPETQHGVGVAELRRGCRCRKPEPGLIFQAWREHGVDLSGAVMIGDRASDVLAARAAGIRAVLVGSRESVRAEAALAAPDASYDSLLAFAKAAAEGAFNPLV